LYTGIQIVHRLAFLVAFLVFLPICQPHDLSTLTTLGVMAAVRGTRMKMKLLWIAYASASCVARPKGKSQYIIQR
jgi:hypothetical protein